MITHEEAAEKIRFEIQGIEPPYSAPARDKLVRVVASFMTDELGGSDQRKLVLKMLFGTDSSKDMSDDMLRQLWVWLGHPTFQLDNFGYTVIVREHNAVWRMLALIPDDFTALKEAKRKAREDRKLLREQMPKSRKKNRPEPVPVDFSTIPF